MNRALIAKNVWRLIQDTDSLASKYGAGSLDINFKTMPSSSFVWKGICKNKEVITNHLSWRLGNGVDIDVASKRWIAPWNGPPGIFRVSDLWDSSSNSWNQRLINGMYDNSQAVLIFNQLPSVCGLFGMVLLLESILWQRDINFLSLMSQLTSLMLPLEGFLEE